MAKNIIIFSDGTGQEGGYGQNTNVYDLFNIVEDRTERQISYYDRGLGTGKRKISGLVFGAGISRNVHDCYQFLSDHYAVGDQIFLFGFSRGAATIRTLASFIHLFGILPRSRPDLVKRAYSIYKIRDLHKRMEQAEELLRENRTMWCRIRFVGVWDTVAALGLPFKTINAVIDWIPGCKHRFHDFRLSQCVDYARQALAIDDERRTFHPLLWDETNKCRDQLNGSFHFTHDDINDADLACVAAKLRMAALEQTASKGETRETASVDPLSYYLARRFRGHKGRLFTLLENVDSEKLSDEEPSKVRELRNALVTTLNEVIDFGSVHQTVKNIVSTSPTYRDDPVYGDRVEDKFAGAALSKISRALIEKKGARKRMPEDDARRRLNRALLVDVYGLRRWQYPRIKQVWFAGSHTDVGGGYADNRLAHIPFVWLVNEAVEFGLLIYKEHNIELNPDAEGQMHNPRAKIGRLYRRGSRAWDTNRNQGQGPLVHQSVLERTGYAGFDYEPWVLKMKHEVEPWPERLRSSIQFDENFVWREALWGWGSNFMIPWNDIQHIDQDDMPRVLRLHVKRSDRKADEPRFEVLEIRGSLHSGVSEMVAQFERRKSDDREANTVRVQLEAKIRAMQGEIDDLRKSVKIPSPVRLNGAVAKKGLRKKSAKERVNA